MKKIIQIIFLVFSPFIVFAQPSNNTCATAASLTYNGGCLTGTNTGADVTGDGIASAPSCIPSGGGGSYNESVWYSVTMPAGQTELVISTLEGTLSAANTGLALYSGTCGSLTELACTLTGGVLSVTGLSEFQTYYILLDGNKGFDGDYCISVSQPPTNDDICDAVTLTVGDGCVLGSTAGSTAETGEISPDCVNGPANTINSVWYQFTATDDSITVNYGDGTLGTSLISSVYNISTCVSLPTVGLEIGCTSNGSEVDLTGLVVGQTYFIVVDAKTTDMGTFCISIYETPPPPPPIGTCDNPRKLYVAADCNNISGRQYDEQNNMLSTDLATGNDGGASMAGGSYLNSVETSCSGTDVGQQGYWVEFIATATSVNVANYGGSGYDYAVFSGTPTNSTCTAGLTQIACVTAGANDLTNSVTGLTVGDTLMMLVTPSGTGTTTTAYACLTGTAYVPPNDACANATTISTSTNYTINNSNATVDNNNSLCSGSTENNTWAVWTADFTGTAYVNLQDQDCINPNGMQMSLYSTTSACCNPNSCGWSCIQYVNPNNSNDFFGTINAVSGTTYYIQFDGYAGTGCTFNFCITTDQNPDCSTISQLSNDEMILNLKENSGTVVIDWHDLEYSSKNYYVVEKSNNGKDYKKIAKVNSRYSSYSIVDDNPHDGNNFYRIKSYKKLGGLKFSKVKTIKIDKSDKSELTLVPNPFNEKLNIVFNAEYDQDSKLEIFDITGRKIFGKSISINKGSNTISDLDLTSISKGIYFIIIDVDSYRIKERLIKE